MGAPRLVITGASGYLGRGILRRAPGEWALVATYLTQPLAHGRAVAFPHAQRSALQLDVRDAAAVDRLVDEWHPDAIIHTAALMRGDGMMATNVEGSRNIARAAARAGAHLVHLSSDVIFDGEHAPYDEDDSPNPISPYGESKARAEEAVRSENPRAAIVRTSLIYGFEPVDPRTRQTLDGEMPVLFTDEYRCPILLDDLVDALIELATLDYAGVLNVAGPQRQSRYEFGRALAHAFGSEPRFSPALSASSPAPRPRDCTLDISRAQRLLSTSLSSVDVALIRLRVHAP